MRKLKILVIEDNRLLRVGTTALLNEQENIIAVATRGNRSALEKAKKLVPDVVLLDLGLKSQSSVTVIEAITKQHPRTEVVVMDLLPAHSDVVEFFKAGVSGYVTRDATLDDFLHTIRSAAKGLRILPPTISESLFSQIVKSAIEEGRVDRVVEAIEFTKHEREVANLMAKGKSIIETSRRLKVATFVVKNHIRNCWINWLSTRAWSWPPLRKQGESPSKDNFNLEGCSSLSAHLQNQQDSLAFSSITVHV